MVVWGFTDDRLGRLEWHRLAGLVRDEGWSIDVSRIPAGFRYGAVWVRPGSPIPFDTNAIALFTTPEGAHLAIEMSCRGALPEHLDAERVAAACRFPRELAFPDEVRFALD